LKIDALKFILFLISSLFPLSVSAQCTTDLCRIIQNTIGVFNKIIILVVLLSLAAFGWGVVKMILAAQNPEERKKAKTIILWSIIGIFIIASVYGIIIFFQTYFGVGGSQNIPAPNLSPPLLPPT